VLLEEEEVEEDMRWGEEEYVDEEETGSEPEPEERSKLAAEKGQQFRVSSTTASCSVNDTMPQSKYITSVWPTLRAPDALKIDQAIGRPSMTPSRKKRQRGL
jgi:hypothetical protein